MDKMAQNEKLIENVRVFIRFRPINEIEIRNCKGTRYKIIITNQNRTVEIESESDGVKKNFNYDYIFDEKTNQVEFFKVCCQPVMNSILKGFQGTRSGKTWSMMGPTNKKERKDPSLRGIIPRASKLIFEQIKKRSNSSEHKISLGYLEIYNDNIKCLLDEKGNLNIRESRTKGIYVEGLTIVDITSLEDIYYYIRLGDLNKKMASTNMNKSSSRSHSIFQLTIEETDKITGSTTIGRVNLVDLAGSEKVKKTKAEGMRFTEARKINSSLSVLGKCIMYIVEKKTHIPYRECKLTRILQESLSGNSKTSIICTVSPHSYNMDETISTLEFGKRAKKIKLVSKANIKKGKIQLEKELKLEKIKNMKILKDLKNWKMKAMSYLKELSVIRELSEEENLLLIGKEIEEKEEEEEEDLSNSFLMEIEKNKKLNDEIEYLKIENIKLKKKNNLKKKEEEEEEEEGEGEEEEEKKKEEEEEEKSIFILSSRVMTSDEILLMYLRTELEDKKKEIRREKLNKIEIGKKISFLRESIKKLRKERKKTGFTKKKSEIALEKKLVKLEEKSFRLKVLIQKKTQKLKQKTIREKKENKIRRTKQKELETKLRESQKGRKQEIVKNINLQKNIDKMKRKNKEKDQIIKKMKKNKQQLKKKKSRRERIEEKERLFRRRIQNGN